VAIWGDHINGRGKLSALADRFLRVVSRHPFATCCVIGFLAGSLLDLDHVPKWLFHINYPVLIPIRGSHYLGQGRNLHGLALVGSGIICTCIGGSILLVVLKDWIARFRTVATKPIQTHSVVSSKEHEGRKEHQDLF
jgi:hypothetical protein